MQKTEMLRPQNEEKAELGFEPRECDVQSKEAGAVITPSLQMKSQVVAALRTAAPMANRQSPA